MNQAKKNLTIFGYCWGKLLIVGYTKKVGIRQIR